MRLPRRGRRQYHEQSLAKVPVLGKRDAEERRVSIRRLGSQAQTGLGLDEALALLADGAGREAGTG